VIFFEKNLQAETVVFIGVWGVFEKKFKKGGLTSMTKKAFYI